MSVSSNTLVGVKVTKSDLKDGSFLIKGEKDGQPVSYQLWVSGDCCSHSWIESVMEKSALDGYTILKVEDLELPEAANGKDCERCGEDHASKYGPHDVLVFYGFAMTTERGRCVIDYRNDSNGYYGGCLEVEVL